MSFPNSRLLFLRSRRTGLWGAADWEIASDFGQFDSDQHQQLVGDGAACNKTSIGAQLCQDLGDAQMKTMETHIQKGVGNT
jgi:hypothetical protein